MKTLLLLSLFVLVSCGGGSGSSSNSPIGTTTTTGNNGGTQNGTVVHGGYADSNVQHFSYDVVNPNQTTLTSTVNIPNGVVFTIPHEVVINSDTSNSLSYLYNGVSQSNFVAIEFANKITCQYNKNGNKFDFHHCESYAASVDWTIQAGDTYIMEDLNQDSQAQDKNKITVNIYSIYNNVLTGHINFSYDL